VIDSCRRFPTIRSQTDAFINAECEDLILGEEDWDTSYFSALAFPSIQRVDPLIMVEQLFNFVAIDSCRRFPTILGKRDAFIDAECEDSILYFVFVFCICICIVIGLLVCFSYRDCNRQS
jgi:hypothetical protein